MNQAFICDAVRTPFGRFGGALATMRADDLAALPLKALLARNPGLDPSRIDDVIFGCANQAGEDNRNVARMALLLAGCIFWDPSRFAAKTSELEIWHGFLLMWAVCSGVIHGVGFRPRAVHWQGIFCPLIADIVLALGLFFFFF